MAKGNDPSTTLCGKTTSLRILSGQTGLTTSYLSYILNGKRNPSTQTLNKIAAAMGLPMDEVYAALTEKANEYKRANEPAPRT